MWPHGVLGFINQRKKPINFGFQILSNMCGFRFVYAVITMIPTHLQIANAKLHPEHVGPRRRFHVENGHCPNILLAAPKILKSHRRSSGTSQYFSRAAAVERTRRVQCLPECVHHRIFFLGAAEADMANMLNTAGVHRPQDTVSTRGYPK